MSPREEAPTDRLFAPCTISLLIPARRLVLPRVIQDTSFESRSSLRSSSVNGSCVMVEPFLPISPAVVAVFLLHIKARERTGKEPGQYGCAGSDASFRRMAEYTVDGRSSYGNVYPSLESRKLRMVSSLCLTTDASVTLIRG